MRCVHLLLLCAVLVLPASGQAVPGERVFYPDDPVWEDPDRLDVPPPAPTTPTQYYDLLLHTFGSPSDYEGPALNVNTLGEVPNSSWYTNRHYRHPMTLDELRAGPNTGPGPSRDAPWTVVAGKREGASRGMQVVDERGDRYLLKFDPPGHPEMATAAEVITTKLFHALGYNVPENHIIYFTRAQLVPGDEATYTTLAGEERPLTAAVIDTLLAQTYRYEDGRYRALASRFIEGEPIGPFPYFGTRPDDANDIYLHEARRELRGLRVFSAWVNHYDARSANTLDAVVTENGRTFVRHYLIDFGSTLGSGATSRVPRWIGHEYVIEWRPVLERAVTLGFGASSWIDIDYLDHPSLGRWEAQHFDPERWKTRYPNPAFERADAADTFWAARQVMQFSDEALRAIVATGQYSDPAAERYVARTLMRRRDEIGEAYLWFGGGLDRFGVEEKTLRWDDLLVRHRLAGRLPERTVRWRTFDNTTGHAGTAFATRTTGEDQVRLPETTAPFLLAEIETAAVGRTRVYLRREGGSYEVVGLRRE